MWWVEEGKEQEKKEEEEEEEQEKKQERSSGANRGGVYTATESCFLFALLSSSGSRTRGWFGSVVCVRERGGMGGVWI